MVGILLMGIMGSGKTTIGENLGKRTGWKYYDADFFHPEQNKEKMRKGIALTDEDRTPWLQSIKQKCLS